MLSVLSQAKNPFSFKRFLTQSIKPMTISEEEMKKKYERSKQHKVFIPIIPQLLEKQHKYQNKMYEYNSTLATERSKRNEIMKEMFSEVGENTIVEPPINSNWGCHNVHLGKSIYINSNVTFVDDNEIFIGDNSLIAPNVCFTTTGHPVLPSLRLKCYQYNFPIHIGKNVWIGIGSIILPGVNIGDNSVIGAGSIVSRDIPPNCVAYGSPCKVIREIGEKDEKYYFKNNKLDVWE